jgi:hypothetical protein
VYQTPHNIACFNFYKCQYSCVDLAIVSLAPVIPTFLASHFLLTAFFGPLNLQAGFEMALHSFLIYVSMYQELQMRLG